MPEETPKQILTLGAYAACQGLSAGMQYCEALSAFELGNGGTGWPYADNYRSLARMRGCLGFGRCAQYASTLSRPKSAHVRRTRDLP